VAPTKTVWTITEHLLEIEGGEAITGSGIASVKIESTKPKLKEPFIMGLATKYVSDALKTLDEDPSIYFTNNVNPIIFQANKNHLALLMPIRLEGSNGVSTESDTV
jgi:DNA polymerase III sliding clamp (beta) subunit (PCNA family)